MQSTNQPKSPRPMPQAAAKPPAASYLSGRYPTKSTPPWQAGPPTLFSFISKGLLTAWVIPNDHSSRFRWTYHKPTSIGEFTNSPISAIFVSFIQAEDTESGPQSLQPSHLLLPLCTLIFMNEASKNMTAVFRSQFIRRSYKHAIHPLLALSALPPPRRPHLYFCPTPSMSVKVSLS